MYIYIFYDTVSLWSSGDLINTSMEHHHVSIGFMARNIPPTYYNKNARLFGTSSLYWLQTSVSRLNPCTCSNPNSKVNESTFPNSMLVNEWSYLS